MKKYGVLNSEISKVLSDLGHTDQIVIADCGLPVPDGIKKIDISLDLGKPSFLEVYAVIMKNMVVEKMILADEIKIHNRTLLNDISTGHEDIEKEFISHEQFKIYTQNAKVIIRTGENTPFANIILQAGVYFGE